MQKEIKDKLEKQSENKTRRAFMKKVAYVAPTLIVLGHLTHPTSAEAEFDGPPGGPSGNPGGGGPGGF